MEAVIATCATFAGMLLGRTRCLLHNCCKRDQQCSLAYNDPKVELIADPSPKTRRAAEEESIESELTIPPTDWQNPESLPHTPPTPTNKAKGNTDFMLPITSRK